MSEKIVCTVPGLKLINELKAELLEEQSLESKYFFSGGDKNLPKNKKDNVLNSLIFKHQPTTKTSIFGEPIISENNVVREKNENNLTITMLKKVKHFFFRAKHFLSFDYELNSVIELK